MDLSFAYMADITKSERDDNGDLIVFGKVTGTDYDLDGDRCDPDWLKKAMPDWFEWANLREMHRPVAAGVGLEMTQDGDDWSVKSKCVDPVVAKKIEDGVYKGHSIGIHKGVREKRDGQSWIVAGEIVEISYVDRPCNPTAKLAIAKAAGSDWQPQEAEAEQMSANLPAAGSAGDVVIKGVTTTLPDGAAVTVNGVPVGGAPQVPPDEGTFTPADEMKALSFIGKAAKQAAGEQSDIDGASEAIAVITRLIESECEGLANGDMGELSDIQLLIEAATALKWFMSSEQREQDGTGAEDDLAYAMLAASADIEKRRCNADQRRQAAHSGTAMPGGRYNIENSEDLHDAIDADGRGKGDHDAIRQHIIRRAKSLGLSGEIPDSWTKKTPVADTGKTVGTTDTIDELVKAAVAEATHAHEERLEALRAELAEVKKTPIPGGPVLLAPQHNTAAKPDSTTKARQMRQYAQTLAPDARRDYLALADKIESDSA